MHSAQKNITKQKMLLTEFDPSIVACGIDSKMQPLFVCLSCHQNSLLSS